MLDTDTAENGQPAPADSGAPLVTRPLPDAALRNDIPDAALRNDLPDAALRAMIGWYGATPPADPPGLLAAYLRARSDWEGHQATQIAAHLAAAASPPNAPPRALLVDDASDILVVVGAFLTAYGFEVLHAPDGDAALQVLAAGGAIDLLVTDYAMPHMTGLELATQVCERHQQLAVLVISGHPNCNELACLPPNIRWLAKPFRRAQLYEHINALLGSHASVRAHALV